MTMTDEQRIAALNRMEQEVLELRRGIAEVRDSLPPMAVAIANLRKEPRATPDTMTAGGWVRPEGQPRWFQVASVAYCNHPHGRPGDCRRVELMGNNASLHFNQYDSVPFLTDEQFDRDCQDEREVA